MKLIKPSFSIWEQQPGLEGIYRQIEQAGRICYKSEDKITKDSAKGFVDRMIKSGHGAMLEHGTVYLKIPIKAETSYRINEYNNNPYTKTKIDCNLSCYYISTNYRVLVEHNWLDDLEYICEPTEFHERRVCVHFVCDRGILAEFTRHRVFSFSAESTRYCNYSKDKFGNEITYILPPWIGETDVRNFYENSKGDNFLKYNEDSLGGSFIFLFNLEELEEAYIALVKEEGWKPQQARAVLPNSLKTELVMTGFVDDWWGEYLVIDKSTGLVDQRIHGKFYIELNNIDRDKYRIVEKGFFPLRCSSGAHPQAQELAIPLRQEFINKKIW